MTRGTVRNIHFGFEDDFDFGYLLRRVDSGRDSGALHVRYVQGGAAEKEITKGALTHVDTAIHAQDD